MAWCSNRPSTTTTWRTGRTRCPGTTIDVGLRLLDPPDAALVDGTIVIIDGGWMDGAVMASAASLAGVYAPICTPFTADEALDVDALRSNIERYADSRLSGYLALGSNGETRSLDEDERRRILQIVVRHRGPDQVVLAGAAYEAQRAAERFLADAAELGADYGLVLSPSYFRKQMTLEVSYRYFATLADTSPLPLILYNMPGVNGITLSPDLVARLADHPRIVGMKDSAASGIEAYLALQRPGFDVLAGSANFLFTAMQHGSPGGTLSLANAFPELALRLYDLGAARDMNEGPAYQAYIARVNGAISGRYGVPGVKAAMDLAGYRGGYPRRPLLPLMEQERAELRATLEGEGVPLGVERA